VQVTKLLITPFTPGSPYLVAFSYEEDVIMLRLILAVENARISLFINIFSCFKTFHCVISNVINLTAAVSFVQVQMQE
jgi:hypothetical protein